MKGGVVMSTETKVLKHFDAEIISCKDYHREYRKICIICRDGKYGLAEMDKTGYPRIVDILIECKYDHIDTFCAFCDFSNMVCVYLDGKCGLYSFRWTVSSKSNKIDCKQIAECEYDFISVNSSSNIAVLRKRDKYRCRYYNLNSDRLSPFYVAVIPADEHYFECITEDEVKCIDIETDFVIYSWNRKHVDEAYPERISRNVYLLIKANYDEPIGEHKSDLVFFNKNLRVSYVIKDIDCLNITRNGLEQWEDNYIFTFRKNGDKHIIAVNDNEWNIESIKAIAKEIEYT